VERSLDWLESTSNRPPFLYLHALEPHSPYEPLAEDSAPFLPAGTTKLHRWPPMIWDYRTGEGWSTWEDLTNLPDVSEERREVMAALYDGEIRFVDRKLGQFFERLKESDLYDRSIIVFVADHGEEFNDHGGWFHGLTVFEEMTSMPLLVKLPRSLGGGIRTTLSVDMVDVFPTLCGLTRMPAPESIRGEDRAEELLAAARGRDVLGFPSCFVERPPHLYSFRVDRWKIIQKTSGGKTVHKLYDLEFDPREQEDLAYVFPDTLVRMRTLLREIIRQVTPAEGFAAQDGPDNLDPETERILRNLGYIN
jgi:arylsulfatase A-like enzyme